MILTVEAFKRETQGGIPLNHVKQLGKEEASRVIPDRIKSDDIYEELQRALDSKLDGLEDEEDDPLEQLAEIMAGMTGFNYTEGDLDMIYEDFVGEGAGASVGAGAKGNLSALAL